MKKLSFLIVLMFAVSATMPGKGSSIDGHWLGTLVLPNGQLRLAITVSGSDGDEIKAVLTSLDQGMAEIPCDKVKLEDNTLTVEATSIGVYMSGPIDGEAKTWDVSFEQGAVSSTIPMKKVDKIPGKE